MKKILVVLAVLGLVNYGADAQTKKSQFDKNYPVCQTKNGYATCSKAQLNAQLKEKEVQETYPVASAPERLAGYDQVVFVKCQSAVDEPTYGGPVRHHIQVSYDQMDNPYKGLPSQQYDGPAKDDERNKNVNQTSIQLPSNMGYTQK